MRITEVNIPKEEINNGLESIKMTRLGSVVLIAGKNGAGKSRVLQTVDSVFRTKPKLHEVETAQNQINHLNEQIKSAERQIENYKAAIASGKDAAINLAHKQQIENQENNILIHKKDLEVHYKTLNWNLVLSDQIAETYQVIPFVPKNLDLIDSFSLKRSEIYTNAQSIDKIGMNLLSRGAFSRIQVTQDRWFNATHQNSTVSEEEKVKAISDYDNLKELISIFLNTELSRNIDDQPTLFGFPLGQSRLSHGQKVLLQLCMAIHCQGKSLEDIILFMDEPENHLHPSIIIETIERLKSKVSNGQIWISTHSIPLLSYFDPSNIWYVDEGKVSYAGNVPEKVLSGLLGDENQIGKLQDFISLPGVFALNRHSFESLFHPVSVETGSDDPQTIQINDEIKKHLKVDDQVRILDYGAGKGRLLSNIMEAHEGNQDLSGWLDYVAFDKFDFDKSDCEGKLSKLYDDSKQRYFNDFQQLFSKYDKGSFDVVVMCNVLHEIDPNDWLKLFSADGEIPRLLSDKGVLLIVEDQEMPIGEKAYQKGFIVLDTPQLKDLFSITESDSLFTFTDARGDGRLKAHRLTKEYLIRITAESRLSALKSLHNHSANQILEIRRQDVNYKNGRRHGFWIQQFANTKLALDELTNK